jgi:hypothetical protein
MMDALARAVAVTTLFAGLTVSLAAQWPPYPTAGVPRLQDGKPDLAAPAPRLADGRPDLSGIWENPIRGGNNAKPPAAAPGAPPFATFWNVGAGFEGDLPFQPWAADLRRKRMAEDSKDNPDAHCLPMGLLQFHTHPQPRQFVQTPTQLLILYEANYGLRRIYLDGRPAPDNDPQPWWYGYSRGRWDGDTLVVETTHFRDGEWLDVNGAPLTDAARVTERYRRLNVGQMDIDVTIDDPKAYTRPWTVRVTHRLLVDADMIEFICHENQRFAPALRQR